MRMSTRANGIPYTHECVQLNRPTLELPTGWYTPFMDYRLGSHWKVISFKVPKTLSNLKLQAAWMWEELSRRGDIAKKVQSLQTDEVYCDKTQFLKDMKLQMTDSEQRLYLYAISSGDSRLNFKSMLL